MYLRSFVVNDPGSV
uniref:Uncharacterized protein n=1 Tax=Rhizophora mucronata TaxID=61149 RepID=A0A2P2MFR2_RHIMU